METVSTELLKQIPFLDHDVLAGRFVSSLAFYDDGWQMWFLAGESGDQKLLKMRGTPAEACYFAKTSEGDQDLFLHFTDFVARFACYRDVQHAFAGIQDDIFNLSASLAKLALLEKSQDEVKRGLSRMATTEVEYIGLICRSLFDLLQEIIQKLWARTHLLDDTIAKKPLKPSFARILLDNNQPRDAAAISARFELPFELSSCYERAGEVFLALRKFRDNIVHNGSQVQHIFAGDGPFLIATGLTPFPNLVLWTEDERRPNDLVPLMPAIETLIFRTLAVCDDFSQAFEKVIQFPPPIARDMHLFMRGYFTDFLIAALQSGERRTAALLTQGGEPAL